MESPKFKRNVLRTVAVKTARAGLRETSQSSQNTNILHAITGLNTEVGGLMQGVSPYLLGFQLNEQILQSTFTSLGGVSYFAFLLAKTLNVKVPGSAKKVKFGLGVTKTEALLKLNNLSVELQYHAMGVFNGGDWDYAAISSITEQIFEILWPLTFEIVKVPPAAVFEDYSTRLAMGFPAGLFSDDKEVADAAIKGLREHEVNVLRAKADAKKAARLAKVAEAALKKAVLEEAKAKVAEEVPAA